MVTDPRLIAFARQMRQEPAPTEKLAWRLLRLRRLAGFRFRIQHPVPPYIADFYCAVARLVVEFDGESHVGQEENDRGRQQFMESKGLRVLRFWNAELFETPDAVEEAIYRACAAGVQSDPRVAVRFRDDGQFAPRSKRRRGRAPDE